MRIDSHQHFWDLNNPKLSYPWMPPSPSPLRKNYLPEDLKPILDASRFDGCVVVQACQIDAEAEWLLGLADKHSFIKGVVAWVNLKDPNVGKRLDQLQKHPRFKGVRHIIQDEPDVNWALQGDVIRGLKELERRDIPYDLLLKPPNLHTVLPLVEKLPKLRMVIDHIAKPLIAQHVMEPWAKQMEAISKVPQISVKLSGMITEADQKNWKAPDLAPYVHHVYQLWGADRCMFGSDWPVCLLAGSWKQVLAALTQVLGPLQQDVREKILGETATKFYRLSA